MTIKVFENGEMGAGGYKKFLSIYTSLIYNEKL